MRALHIGTTVSIALLLIGANPLAAQSPELAQVVEQMLAQMQQPGAGPQGAVMNSATQVDMRPQPEQRPARRMAAAV